MIFYHSDLDGLHARLAGAGHCPDFPPHDGRCWGERYFHITDPDGHELSFARPLWRQRPEDAGGGRGIEGGGADATD